MQRTSVFFYHQTDERIRNPWTGIVSDHQITLSSGGKEQPVNMAQEKGPSLGHKNSSITSKDQEDRMGGAVLGHQNALSSGDLVG